MRNNTYIGIVPANSRYYTKISGVYLIFNSVSNRYYIGSSVDIHDRWSEHKRDLKKNRHKNIILQNSWNKHGESAFILTVLAVVSKDELLKVEQEFINNTNPKYNICMIAGKTVGYKHTEQSIIKMKKNHADFSGSKNPMYGIKLLGDKNPMYGKSRPDTSEFNKRTKKGRSWEEQYGKEKADKLKKELALKMKNNQYSKRNNK